MSFQRPFVPKSDVKQWFTTDTTVVVNWCFTTNRRPGQTSEFNFKEDWDWVQAVRANMAATCSKAQ